MRTNFAVTGPRSPLRPTLGRLAEAFIEGVLDVIRGVPLAQLDISSELRNAPRRAQTSSALSPEAASMPPSGEEGTFDLAEVEQKTIAAALRAASGDRGRAAALLRISKSMLYAKLLRNPELVPPKTRIPVSREFNLADAERQTIAAALRAVRGNRSRAATLLGIPRSSLYTKLEKYPDVTALGPRSTAIAFKAQGSDFNLAKAEERTLAAALRAAGGRRSLAAALLGIPRATLYAKVAQYPSLDEEFRHGALSRRRVRDLSPEEDK